MMIKALIFALMVTYCLAGCIQSDWAGTLSCTGRDVTTFPHNLTNPESVSHIDILNTSLTSLPDIIKSFPNLWSMDIRDNFMLNCDDVLAFKDNYNNITLTTDCDENVWQHCLNHAIQVLSKCKI